jgi:hypothetical protein
MYDEIEPLIKAVLVSGKLIDFMHIAKFVAIEQKINKSFLLCIVKKLKR